VGRKKTSSQSGTSSDVSGDVSGREPYEAPRIVYREPLEAVATACGAPPAKGTPAVCPIGPISS
jgi:hypothetical protein